MDRFSFKPNSPFSTALLRHYVEGSGDPVSLADVPKAWRELVAKKTHGRPGHYRDVSSYDAGIYDMQATNTNSGSRRETDRRGTASRWAA
jgi:hypothetical protein